MEPLYLTTAIPFVNGVTASRARARARQTDAIARHARAPRAADPLPDRHRRERAEGRAGRGRGGCRRRGVRDARTRTCSPPSPRRCGSRTTTSSAPAPIRVTLPTVEAIWRACLASGDLYRAPYAGWYCAGCEQFVDGACDEHDAPPEWVEEENWYFRLSRYAEPIRALIRSGAAAHRPRRASQRGARVPRRPTCATSASRVRAPGHAAGAYRCPTIRIRSSTCGSTRSSTTSAPRRPSGGATASSAARDRQGHRPVPRGRSGPRSCCRPGSRSRPSCSSTTT